MVWGFWSILCPSMKERGGGRSGERFTSLEQAKRWAEQEYRRFTGPLAKWSGMAMLALTTQGCGTLGIRMGGALVGETTDPAQVTFRPDAAPSLGRDDQGRDRTMQGGALSIGIEAKPKTPEDTQWWKKGEGIYDAREIYGLMDVSETASADTRTKKDARERLEKIREGKMPGYLAYGSFGPRPTQFIAIVEQRTAMPKGSLDGKKIHEPLQETYARGLALFLPKAHPEAGIRIVPHGERKWSSGEFGPDPVYPYNRIPKNTEHHGEMHIALRLEETPTLVLEGETASVKQRLLRDAFKATEKAGEIVNAVEEGKVYEDGKQRAVLMRIGVPQLEETWEKMERLQKGLPFMEEIRALQEKQKKGIAPDADLSKQQAYDRDTERLMELEAKFASFIARLEQPEAELVTTRGKRPARQQFEEERIVPLERQIAFLKMNLSQAEARPPQAGSDAWGKLVIWRVELKEKQAELEHAYAEREKIPADKKVDVELQEVKVKPMSEVEKKAMDILRKTYREWKKLAAEHAAMAQKVRTEAFPRAVVALGAGSTAPMEFHMRIDGEHGLVAMVVSTEK